MELLGYEFKKIFGNKIVRYIFVIGLLLNLIAVFMECRETGIPKDDFKNIMKLYDKDPEFVESEYERIKENLLNYIAKYEEAAMLGDEINTFAHEFQYVSDYENFTDWDLLGTFFEKRNAVNQYRDNLQLYIQNARQNQERYQLFGGVGTFADRYQTNIIETYQYLYDNNKLDFDYIYGWDTVFGYRSDAFITFMCILFIVIYSVIVEFHTKANILLSTTKKGRYPIGWSKGIAIIITCFVFSFMIRCESICVVGMIHGYSNCLNPVQLIQEFTLCPYMINCIQLLIYSLLIYLIGMILLSTSVLCITILTASFIPSLLGSVAFLGIEYVIANLITSSHWKYFNIFSMVDTECIWGRLRMIPFWDCAIDLLCFISLTSVIISLSGLFLFAQLYSRNCHTTKKTNQTRRYAHPNSDISDTWTKVKISNLRASSFSSNLLYWEYQKGRVSLFVLFFMMICFLFTLGNQPTKPFYDIAYKEYMEQLEGLVTEEKIAYIKKEADRINDIIQSYDEKYSLYREQKISTEEIDSYMESYRYAIAHKDAIDVVVKKSVYLIEYHNLGEPVAFLYDTDLIAFFSRQYPIFLSIVIVLFTYYLISTEYKANTSASSFDQILRVTRYGRKRTFLSKYILSICISCILLLLQEIIAFYVYIIPNGISSFSWSLLSIQAYGDWNCTLTIAEYLTYMELSRLFGVIMLSVLSLSAAWICKGNMISVILSLILTTLPGVLKILNPNVPFYMDFTNVLSGDQLIAQWMSNAKLNYIYLGISFSLLSVVMVLMAYYSYVYTKFIPKKIKEIK